MTDLYFPDYMDFTLKVILLSSVTESAACYIPRVTIANLSLRSIDEVHLFSAISSHNKDLHVPLCLAHGHNILTPGPFAVSLRCLTLSEDWLRLDAFIV